CYCFKRDSKLMLLIKFNIAVRLLVIAALVAAVQKVAMVRAEATGEAAMVLVETESADDLGGWVVDQQFMDLMGSPYLLAHGLGEPVRDAVLHANLPVAGAYHVWVRTRDWVAPWKAPGAPGRFQIVMNGKVLGTTFGTDGAAWHWQDGGEVE